MHVLQEHLLFAGRHVSSSEIEVLSLTKGPNGVIVVNTEEGFALFFTSFTMFCCLPIKVDHR